MSLARPLWVHRLSEQRLIGELYDAAITPDRWDEALRSLIALFDARGGLAISSPTSTLAVIALRQGVGAAAFDSFRRQFVQGALDRDGRLRTCAAFIRRGRDRCRPPTLCALIRADDQPPFGHGDRARLQALMPHLARALGMTFRMSHADGMWTAARQTLDRVSSAVLLVGAGGEMLFANQPARRVIAARVGSQARVAKAIKAALRGAKSIDAEGVLLPSSGGPPLALQFMRVRAQDKPTGEGSAARIAVFITDPGEDCMLDRGALRELYRLTPSEAALAEHLCSGTTLQDAARKLGTSAHTARSHLKNVFHKTGVTRQQDLMRLLVALTPRRQHALPPPPRSS